MSKTRNINDCNCESFEEKGRALIQKNRIIRDELLRRLRSKELDFDRERIIEECDLLEQETRQIAVQVVQARSKRVKHHEENKYYGVVCKESNPEEPEAMLVPSEIYGYRTFPFSFSSGLYGFDGNDRIAKPWDLYATCRAPKISTLPNQDIHQAPNPYCTCGFYSQNEIRIQHNLSDRFGHIMNPSDFDKIVAKKADQSHHFPLVSKVSLKGKIIECEKGYRSERIYPEEFMTIIDLDALFKFYEERKIQERLRKKWWNFVIKQIMLFDKKFKETPFLQGFQYTTYIISPETYLTAEYWRREPLLFMNAYSKLLRQDVILQGDNQTPVLKPLSLEVTDEAFKVLRNKKMIKRREQLWQR